MTSGGDLSRSRILAALAAIMLLAGVLRLVGISCGLPHMSDPDNVIVRQARRLELVREDPAAPGGMPGMYPMLFARVLDGLPGELMDRVDPEWTVERHRRAAAHPYVLARTLIALLSILVVPGTYLLARRFLPPSWALFAAALAATSLLHADISRQARPHGAVTTFVLFGVVAALWMVRSGSVASCATAGLAAAVAVASLHNGAAVLPALAVAGLLLLRRHGLRAWPRLVLPALLPIAGALAFYPKLLEGNVMGLRDFEGRPILTGAGFGRSLQYLWGADPVLLVLAILGAILGAVAGARAFRSARRDRPETGEVLVACAFAVPYLAAIGMYFSTWARFLTPLIPFLACLGAGGAAWVARGLPRPNAPRLAPLPALALAVGLLALPVYAAGRWALLHARPHTLDAAARWLEAHADPASDVVFVSFLLSPAVLEAQESLELVPRYARSPFQDYLLTNGVSGDLRMIPLVSPGKGNSPKELEAAELARFMESRGGGDYALLFAPGEREFLSVSEEAVRARGGRRALRIVSNPTLGPDAGFGANRRLGRYRALAVALTASAIGPEIDLYELP